MLLYLYSDARVFQYIYIRLLKTIQIKTGTYPSRVFSIQIKKHERITRVYVVSLIHIENQ